MELAEYRMVGDKRGTAFRSGSLINPFNEVDYLHFICKHFKKTRILMKSFFYRCLWRIQYVNIFHCLKAFFGSVSVLRLDSKGGYQSNRNGMETFLF